MTEKRGIFADRIRARKTQIWVETVIYTLIGLTLIGLVIGIVTPKINQINDRLVITQTVNSLNKINEEISSALTASGNTREIQLTVKKGEYSINGANDTLSFALKNSNLLYSQPNESIKQGDITIITKQTAGKKYDISLTLNYALKGLNITYNNKDEQKILTPAPRAYKLLLENRDGKQINIIPLAE